MGLSCWPAILLLAHELTLMLGLGVLRQLAWCPDPSFAPCVAVCLPGLVCAPPGEAALSNALKYWQPKLFGHRAAQFLFPTPAITA